MSLVINVVRFENEGRLTFDHGQVKVDTPCWWDPQVVVKAGTYKGTATRMPGKADGFDGGKREAIWLGRDIPILNRARPSFGIFIHKGKNASWSDGCIVCDAAEVTRIWKCLPEEGRDAVTINVSDAVPR